MGSVKGGVYINIVEKFYQYSSQKIIINIKILNSFCTGYLDKVNAFFRFLTQHSSCDNLITWYYM